jgi:hypothetical protein
MTDTPRTATIRLALEAVNREILETPRGSRDWDRACDRKAQIVRQLRLAERESDERKWRGASATA